MGMVLGMEMRHTLTWNGTGYGNETYINMNGTGYGNETYINMGMVLGMEMRHTLTWEWYWVWE